MKPFFLYLWNNAVSYSAESVFETDKHIFLAESNLPISDSDIGDLCIKNNNFYILVIIDKQTLGVTAKYGYGGYCHSLYWYQNNGALFLDLSLKHLLENVDIVPTLNLKGAKEFVKYGFLNNDGCLINGIKRLPSLKKLIYGNGEVSVTDDAFGSGINVASGDYTESLSQGLPADESGIILPLSGGFDSTFLAYLLRNHRSVTTVTVGSMADSENEFDTAKNTALHLKVPNKQLYASGEWLEYLPKMVDLFEGEMFDPGVFVCWAITEYVKAAGLKDSVVVTGDGADQLMNLLFYGASLEKPPMTGRHEASFWVKCPKHCFYYLVTKKLEWILHENGISYRMPFLSDAFLANARLTRTASKEEYKKFVKKTLPAAIARPLGKKGGMVDESYFISADYRKKFLDLLAAPKYKAWFQPSSKSFRPLLYKVYIILFNYIYVENKSIDMPFSDLLDVLIKDAQ